MKTVITVVGKDAVGILAKVSGKCAEYNINIAEVTQSILDGMFCMIMVGEVDGMKGSFASFAEEMEKYGDSINMKIHVMHEDLFNSMHRI